MGSVLPKDEEARVEHIFAYFYQDNPHPSCSLVYTNPFTLLLSVVLSAQTTDKSVNRVMSSIREQVDTPEKVLVLGEKALEERIRSIGLFRRKSRALFLLSSQLIQDFQGKIPSSREALMGLPGVGRKTANVLLNILYDKPTIPVDTHVFRVARRLAIARGATPLALEHSLEKEIPLPYRKDAHFWLIDHGRRFCKAHRPLCASCPLASLCPFPRKGIL